MDFSVIIASRNRPVLVRAAIQSVLDQTHPSVEIVLVNDGSDIEHAAAYDAIKQELAGRGSFIDLRQTKHGHGPSYAYNRGSEVAQGDYLCFLDDDDCWTVPEHLSRAWAALKLTGRQAETYFTNQKAYANGALIERQIWLAALERQLRGRFTPSADGVYSVTVDALMVCEGFAHVNNTIVSRDLFKRIEGFDEKIRYEGDRDFYHRNVDNARGILYSPCFVSRHNVPDSTKKDNESTSRPQIERLLSRTYVWNKARILSSSWAIRKVAKRGSGYNLRQIAQLQLQDGRTGDALSTGLEALGAMFSFKWLVYCGYLALRAACGRTFPKTRP